MNGRIVALGVVVSALLACTEAPVLPPGVVDAAGLGGDTGANGGVDAATVDDATTDVVGLAETGTTDLGSSCVDMDEDGYPATECGGKAPDCDDNNPNANPGRTEVCDRMDLDEDCNPCTVAGATDGDGDGDTFISSNCANAYRGTTPMCPASVRVEQGRTSGRDCDDTNRSRNPDTSEQCNRLDDNCNGIADEGLALRSFWPDLDMDGEGDTRAPAMMACQASSGFVDNMRDCNDSDRTILTTSLERCDGIDQNCNGMIDEGVTVAGACPTGFPNRCAAGQNYCGGARPTDSSGFIKDWLIIGPFSSAVTPTVQLDARDLIGGEANATPTVGMMAGGQTWTEWRSGIGETGALTQCNGVDLGRLFASPGSTSTATNMTAYVYANIYSPSARMAELALGCDDGCRAWLNGTSVASRMGPSGCIPDDVRGNVRLLAGMNRLLVKVTNGNGASGVTARFRWPGVDAPMRDLTVGLSPAHRALQCGQTNAPAVETCNMQDDNCDGAIDERCPCTIGATRECYTGRAGTQGVGVCRSGTQQCSATSDGSAQWGPCLNERVPSTELCSGADEDCDTNAYNGYLRPGTLTVCRCNFSVLALFPGTQLVNGGCSPSGACNRPTITSDPVAGRADVSYAFFRHDVGQACTGGWCYSGTPPVSSALNVYAGAVRDGAGGSALSLPAGRYRFTANLVVPFGTGFTVRMRILNSASQLIAPGAEASLNPVTNSQLVIRDVTIASECTPFDIYITVQNNFSGLPATFSVAGVLIERIA